MKTAFVLIALCWSCSHCFGHMDDIGDVHPYVNVEGGRFVVNFVNNKTKKQFKTTIGADGKVIERRKEGLSSPMQELAIKLPEELTGMNISRPEGFYVVPEWHRKHHGKPFILRLNDTKKTRIELEWGNREIDNVHGVAITDKYYVFTTSEMRPKKDGEPFPFNFISFRRDTNRLVQSTEIGNPIRVYDYPLNSQIVISGGFAYVAWMGIKDKTFGLILSRFDPKTGALESRTISPGHGNGSPSMGVIGDHVLIAFHRPTKWQGYCGTGAKIIYEFHSLNDVFKPEEAEPGPRK